VPSSTIKDIMNKRDSDGRRGKWIAKIQEYNIEINLTKLIKGQGLNFFFAESNCKALKINLVSQTIEHPILELGKACL
jgi:hypothetical protein